MSTIALGDAASTDVAVASEATARPRTASRGIWTWVAISFLALLALSCLCAPLYARYVAHTTPDAGNLAGSIFVNGEEVEVVSSASSTVDANGELQITPGGVPIGPQWFAAGGRYVLGADEQGRDVAVRLLYGGRLSLAIGFVAATICISLSTLLALLSGYIGGWVDAGIGRVLDVIWSFPWLLLSVAIGTSVALGGFNHFGVRIEAGSFALIVAMLTYGPIPYYARALRSRVLILCDLDFVRAARLAGARAPRILIGELLPNIAPLLPAMFALDFANVLLSGSRRPATHGLLGIDDRGGPDPALNCPVVDPVPGLCNCFERTLLERSRRALPSQDSAATKERARINGGRSTFSTARRRPCCHLPQ
jgi:peptide/nickel transport system permease protein